MIGWNPPAECVAQGPRKKFLVKLENKRIFIVEDDAYNLAIMSSFIRREGARLEFDRWGYDTVYRLTRFLPIDIILLDLMLPNNTSGYTVFRRIRETPELKDVPVLIVTAADPDVEMEKARQAGFQGYISKPFPLNFTQLVAQAIAGEHVWFTHEGRF